LKEYLHIFLLTHLITMDSIKYTHGDY